MHGFVKDFRSSPHSSYSVLNSDKSTRFSLQEVLDWFGGPRGFRAFHEVGKGPDLPPSSYWISLF